MHTANNFSGKPINSDYWWQSLCCDILRCVMYSDMKISVPPTHWLIFRYFTVNGVEWAHNKHPRSLNPSSQCAKKHISETKLCIMICTILLYGHHSTHLVSTHWGRVMHTCFSKLTIAVSDNGLSPGKRQVTIWTDTGILSTEHLGTDFSEISIIIYIFLFKKMNLEISSAETAAILSQPQCINYTVSYHS